MNLLSVNTFVEAPFIIVKIGDYTFGAYKKSQQPDNNGIKYTVTYPNYVESINITKINGAINTYTLSMVYPISKGDDPNLLEKVFSSVSGSRKIVLSYGDWSSPSFIYKDEEAIITNIKSNVDFAGGKIKYTLECVSSSLALKANNYDFPKRTAKPSDVLFEILYNQQYHLLDIFKGMLDKNLVRQKGLIATDDKAVTIPAKQSINIIDYLNFLVNCMESTTNTSNSSLNDSKYFLYIVDDVKNEFGGPYFSVKKVVTKISKTNSLDVYDIDVGYPGDNLVTNFSIDNNETWSILYDFSEKIEQQNYIYRINNEGQYESIYSPNILSSNPLKTMTPAQRNWWTQVTSFPITATLTLKGLLRPTMLMTYLRIHCYFYGAEYIASGTYIITKQQDSISSNGYSTTLSLTRISDTDDYGSDGGSAGNTATKSSLTSSRVTMQTLS